MKTAAVIMLMGSALLVGCGTSKTPEATRAPSALPYYNFTGALNSERAAVGLKSLRRDRALDAIARRHAADMTAQNFFSHVGSDGSTILKRVRRTGYNACYAAENIAWGQTSEAQVFREWHESPGHRKNNLSKRADSYGLGRDGKNWVTVFAADC
ncbi:MAG: CAP domain-containing protein [Pseudomonadota bacterium]